MAAEWVQDVLARQLAMNAQTWATLRGYGVDESTELVLDFFFVAPSEHAAWELAAFLRGETDYTITVSAARIGVKGSTQPTAVSLEILDQWVDWMVSAGAEYGECEFDGWGAQVP